MKENIFGIKSLTWRSNTIRNQKIDINYFATYWGKVLNELLLFVEGNGRFFFSNSHREGWFLKTNSSLIDAIFHVMVFAFFSVCVCGKSRWHAITLHYYFGGGGTTTNTSNQLPLSSATDIAPAMVFLMASNKN